MSMPALGRARRSSRGLLLLAGRGLGSFDGRRQSIYCPLDSRKLAGLVAVLPLRQRPNLGLNGDLPVARIGMVREKLGASRSALRQLFEEARHLDRVVALLRHQV